MEKITKKDFYKAIMTLVEAVTVEDYVEGMTGEMITSFCAAEIGHLEKKAAKAKETAATKRAEGDALTEAIKAALVTDEFKTIPTLVADVIMVHPDTTAGKVTARLTKLIEAGYAERQEVTVPTADGKNRKVKGYRLIETEVEIEE